MFLSASPAGALTSISRLGGKTMPSSRRYIPPSSPLDPPREKLILSFEAVANVTPAFVQLRANIFPRYAAPFAPVNEIKKWQRQWRLDFPEGDIELQEAAETWIFNVLDFWLAHPEVATTDPPRVDCAWWERDSTTIRATDKPQIHAALNQWNWEREDLGEYARGMRSRLESFLRDQRRPADEEMEKYLMRPFQPRRRADRDDLAAFGWLPQARCIGLTDGQIANRYRVSRERVKKAGSDSKYSCGSFRQWGHNASNRYVPTFFATQWWKSGQMI